MAIRIDKKKCIGCGLCASICDEVFEMTNDGKAKVKNPKAKCINEAKEICPVNAIK